MNAEALQTVTRTMRWARKRHRADQLNPEHPRLSLRAWVRANRYLLGGHAVRAVPSGKLARIMGVGGVR